jgi:hypothetical protein
MRDEYGNTLLACALFDKDDTFEEEMQEDDDEYDGLVYRLLKQDPDDVKVKDYSNSYPLHLACGFKHSFNVIKTIVNMFPQAGRQKDTEGNYPLHISCRPYANWKAVLLLLQKFPETASKRNDDKKYPLHLALDSGMPDTVVLEIFKAYPEAVYKKDSDGGYPLSVAVDCTRSYNIIYPMLKEWPKISMMKSEELLRIACRVNASEEVIFLLLDTYPLAVKWGKVGHRVVDTARQMGCSEKVISMLEIVSAKSKKELENRFGIPNDVSIHGFDKPRRYETYEWLLINKPILIPTYVQKLLPTSSKKVISTLELVTTKSKKELQNCCAGIPYDGRIIHGFDNLQRYDMFQWLLLNTPISILTYVQLQQSTTAPSRKRKKSKQ